VSASPEEFAAIALDLRDGRTVEQTYEVIVSAAPRVVDGCERAAIGVLEGDGFKTAAASDDVMRHIDTLQNHLSEGPCLEASAEATLHLDNDIQQHCQWPRLAERVLAETPVRAMLAVPLIVDGRRSGALNLFADRAGAFGEDSTEAATILAAFATVAISRAAEAERADQLQEGLASNREIGAAIGILMATRNLSQEQAFAVLSQASQRLNRKLRDIAGGIVRGERRD
jgi:transcriptional regulator with GAF, ATPase, and Fis domain